MQNESIIQSHAENNSGTTRGDIPNNVRKQVGPLNYDEIVGFFKVHNRFMESLSLFPGDIAVLNEFRIDFCHWFFEEDKDNADLLCRLAQEPEVNEFLAGAYKTAAKATFDMDFVDRMNDLSKTYSFVLPTEEEMHLECVELSKKIPKPGREQLQIVLEVQNLCIRHKAPVTMISGREGYDPLVTDISADDCKDQTVVDATAIHAVVTATMKSGFLLICAHVCGGNYVTGYESVNGYVSPMDSYRLQISAAQFLPGNVMKDGWTCVDSFGALDSER